MSFGVYAILNLQSLKITPTQLTRIYLELCLYAHIQSNEHIALTLTQRKDFTQLSPFLFLLSISRLSLFQTYL